MRYLWGLGTNYDKPENKKRFNFRPGIVSYKRSPLWRKWDRFLIQGGFLFAGTCCIWFRKYCLSCKKACVESLFYFDFSSELTKCQTMKERARKRQSQGFGHSTSFVPKCTSKGTFDQVQCHNRTGYCWCSTDDGRPIPGSSVKFKQPNCSTSGKFWQPLSGKFWHSLNQGGH